MSKNLEFMETEKDISCRYLESFLENGLKIVTNCNDCCRKKNSSTNRLPARYGNRPYKGEVSACRTVKKSLTFPSKSARLFSRKAATKTRASVRFPERVPLWCKASVPLPQAIPLLSRVRGNATPGAPVKASMSDGICRNQGGTVEYFVSHP